MTAHSTCDDGIKDSVNDWLSSVGDAHARWKSAKRRERLLRRDARYLSGISSCDEMRCLTEAYVSAACDMAEMAMEQQALIDGFERAMLAIDADTASMIRMHYVDGLTWHQVAMRVNWSTPAVKRRVGRAKPELYALMPERFRR